MFSLVKNKDWLGNGCPNLPIVKFFNIVQKGRGKGWSNLVKNKDWYALTQLVQVIATL